MMTTLTIGEVARRAGFRKSALRYYEAVGVLPPARRVAGQRRYDEAVLTRLAVVRLAQEVGFTVAEIRSLVEGFDDEGVAPERWRERAAHKLTEVDALIHRAQRMKHLLEESLHCGCLTLDTCTLVLERADGGKRRQPRTIQSAAACDQQSAVGASDGDSPDHT